MINLLRGNTQECLVRPLLRHIAGRAREAGGSFRLRPLAEVTQLLIEDGRVAGLEVRTPATSPSLDPVRRPAPDPAPVPEPVDGAVILAVPPAALGRLVSEQVFHHAPQLARVRKLRSQPMASIDVYFKRRIASIPSGITILLDSEQELTFLDNSQAWGAPHADGPTFLNVVISDFRTIAPYSRSASGRQGQKERVFAELRHYLEFHYDPDTQDDDIDRERCYMQTNIGEQLFINEVGSWENRPTTTCGIPNLFIAGDHCRTFIDVTTIEGAVVSGLMAAEGVRRLARTGAAIEPIRPETYPQAVLSTMKSVAMPSAYAAKALSAWSEIIWSGYKQFFPNG
jgi:zeta-carotene desaturase